MTPTHAVENQPPPLAGHNVFLADLALREAMEREGADWALPDAAALGELAGRPEMIELGFQANANLPRLVTHDRYGHRVDEVEYHPSWHALMRVAVAQGLHAEPWRDPRPGAHAARAARCLVWSQVEAGHMCPIDMTYAIHPALRREPGLAALWEPGLESLVYDFGLRPAASKRGLLAGMAMTEKQGGSDVRVNTTRAAAVAGGGTGGEYRLTGHKWFCSAPMCDLFLVLAQADAGLACFLVPRVLPDGTRNPFHLQRLKDKLGNRANASSEVEFADTTAFLIGEEGHGVQVIIDMVNLTRLGCVSGSTALMRQALVQAIHHCSHRMAFGRRLVEQPLMANVLADLAIESEAATLLTLRLAGALDRSLAGDQSEEAFRRIATAVGKYWVCKRAPLVAGEALECLGGNGYVEESGMPRLYREAPLNSIWEGSGNVNALDLLRAAARQPASIAALCAELRLAAGASTLFDVHLASLESDLTRGPVMEVEARRMVERIALGLQAGLLLRYAPTATAEAFCRTRLGGEGGRAFGTLPPDVKFNDIIDRAWAPAAS